MQLVWQRADLRLHDNPALEAALRMGGGFLMPVVVIDPHIFARSTTTPRRAAWFLENVRALRAAYRERGSDLIVREGKPAAVLAELAKKHGVTDLHFVANHTPYAKERDAAVAAAMESLGVRIHPHEGQYPHPPGAVLTKEGGRFSVFGAYHRAWLATPFPHPIATPRQLPPVPARIARGDIPRVESDISLPVAGEAAAQALLKQFLRSHEAGYAESRNLPAQEEGTSRLSPYFNLGVLSRRQAARQTHNPVWRAELCWSDFNADLLDRDPGGGKQEYRANWHGFPWRHAKSELQRWKEGQTGYPIVDAGMRELRATGFMHNRVRMITASFLTKHLLIDWRHGEEIFRGWLLDGDSAQNIGNWQWVAGCGHDAAPYFRIFNPVTQGKKFDPEGDYVRRWVPELTHVSSKLIHEPWRVDLSAAEYPPPMIELDYGRQRFLETAQQFLK